MRNFLIYILPVIVGESIRIKLSKRGSRLPDGNKKVENHARKTPPEGEMKNWKLTKDRPRIGPPLGGAVCFTLQASGVVYEPAEAAGLAGLFAALVIGTTTGWLIEEVATRVAARMKRGTQKADQAHSNN